MRRDPIPVPPIATRDEAILISRRLAESMDSLVALVDEETRLVRASRLAEAAALEPAKGEIVRRYLADADRVKASPGALSRLVPEEAEALGEQHRAFHDALSSNLMVLATAHAVAEGILKGVAEEMTKATRPQTYGAAGSPVTPRRPASQPIAVYRAL